MTTQELLARARQARGAMALADTQTKDRALLAMAEELEADVIRQICGSLEEADSDSRRIELICLYIEQNMATVQMLVGNNIDPEFPKKLFDLPQLKGMIVTRLSQQFDGESQEYIYTFIINGCYCMIQRWLSQDTQRPFDEVAQLMRDMIGKICM